MAIAAVVVCHNSDDIKLSQTVAALSKSTNQDFEVFLAAPNPIQTTDFPNTQWLKVSAIDFEKAVGEFLPALTQYEWVWLLNAGQQPEPQALAELLKIAETSSSAALIAPKLTDPLNPRVIQSFGLTLTPRASLFESVRGEFDQAQHDFQQDSLAVCLEGSLVSPLKVQNCGGAQTTLTNLAADLELGIRLRLRGQRVLLAPSARVVSHQSGRESSRASDFQLKLFYFSLPKSILFWLLLPLLVTVESLWLLLRKQPEKIPAELGSGFKVFFTALRIWLARGSLSRRERSNLRSLRSLFATSEAVRNSRLQQSYLDVETHIAANQSDQNKALALFPSGAGWVAALLFLVSLQYWPSDKDVSAVALLPMGDSWLNVFTATGSGFQNIGTGFYAPSDPFNWVLLALASLTFWAPGLAIALLIFSAKSLAFAFAFKALSLVTKKVWLAIAAALTYALWPGFTVSASQGRIPLIIAHLLVPVLVFALARVASSQNQTKQSTWGFVALAALAAAAISVSAPVLTVAVLVAWLAISIAKFRKLPYLIWVLLPMVVLWLPTIWFRVVGLGQPLSVLADPGLPVASEKLGALQLLTASSSPELSLLNLVAISAVTLIAAVALWRNSSVKPFAIWLVALISVVGAWAFQHIEFVSNPVVGETGQIWVNGSPQPWLSVLALCLAFLAVLALDSFRFARIGGLLFYPALAMLALVAVLQPTSVIHTDGRVVPALVRAEAEQSSSLKLLVVQGDSAGRFSATLVSSDGIHYADLNTSYRFALASQKYDEVASVAAKLVSASSEDLGVQLRELNIGYVMVPNPEDNSLLVSNIESVIGLTSVGQTEFGQLFRVAGITELPTQKPTNQDLWSVTKGIQLTVILLYVLLAIPNRRREQNSSVETDVFETEEGEANV